MGVRRGRLSFLRWGRTNREVLFGPKALSGVWSLDLKDPLWGTWMPEGGRGSHRQLGGGEEEALQHSLCLCSVPALGQTPSAFTLPYTSLETWLVLAECLLAPFTVKETRAVKILEQATQTVGIGVPSLLPHFPLTQPPVPTGVSTSPWPISLFSSFLHLPFPGLRFSH